LIIEHYRDQDLIELRAKVIYAYAKTIKESCECERCSESYISDFDNWHPEKDENYNDTWKIIDLLEQYGYHTYEYDKVMYRSIFESVDKGKKYSITGLGLNFNQAVCNMFVKFAEHRKILSDISVY